LDLSLHGTLFSVFVILTRDFRQLLSKFHHEGNHQHHFVCQCLRLIYRLCVYDQKGVFLLLWDGRMEYEGHNLPGGGVVRIGIGIGSWVGMNRKDNGTRS